MPSARFTDPAHSSGIFIRDNGDVTEGPLPPNAGDIREEYDAWIAQGNEPKPYDPASDVRRPQGG
jgi:hypothetical protein